MEEDAGTTLAAALRRRMAGWSWNEVRRLVETGKVRVNGEVVVEPAARVSTGGRLAIVMGRRDRAPRSSAFAWPSRTVTSSSSRSPPAS
jgi:ribosomal protein S4